MNLLGEVITDVAGLFAILAGMRYGFHWLDKKLETWIGNEVKKEVGIAVKQEIHDLELLAHENKRRLDLIDMWIGGYTAAGIGNPAVKIETGADVNVTTHEHATD